MELIVTMIKLNAISLMNIKSLQVYIIVVQKIILEFTYRQNTVKCIHVYSISRTMRMT